MISRARSYFASARTLKACQLAVAGSHCLGESTLELQNRLWNGRRDSRPSGGAAQKALRMHSFPSSSSPSFLLSSYSSKNAPKSPGAFLNLLPRPLLTFLQLVRSLFSPPCLAWQVRELLDPRRRRHPRRLRLQGRRHRPQGLSNIIMRRATTSGVGRGRGRLGDQ